jgi:Glutaminase
VGDTRHGFTIQSISKAVTYGLALEDNGIDAMLRTVDVELSGEAFNSISLRPEDSDRAIEWCEDRLLERFGDGKAQHLDALREDLADTSSLRGYRCHRRRGW